MKSNIEVQNKESESKEGSDEKYLGNFHWQ